MCLESPWESPRVVKKKGKKTRAAKKLAREHATASVRISKSGERDTDYAHFDWKIQ